MDWVQRILKVLTLTTASLAVPFVLLFLLNAILTLGEPSGTPVGPLETLLVLTLLVLTLFVLTAPLIFIFLLSFNRVTAGRWQYTATCIIVLNVLLLLTMLLMTITGVIPSDPKVPAWLELSLLSVFAAPSLLFLLNRLIGNLRAR